VGVRRILAISAVGSINPRFSPGDYVIVDDFLDLTKRRECTYYEGIRSQKAKGDDKVARLLREGKVVHVDMSEPYCSHMRRVLADVLEERRLPYHSAGTYACTEGPRFETPAEIKAIEKLGGDIVGMTGYPEVVLAKELTMCYASLCVVTNPAADVGHRLTSEEVISLMKKKEKEIRDILMQFIERLPGTRECNCVNALEGAEI
ncbi:MAG: S-methyl-5'-thioadenosine phosphorylase, partial [Aquificaceae bacterium]